VVVKLLGQIFVRQEIYFMILEIGECYKTLQDCPMSHDKEHYFQKILKKDIVFTVLDFETVILPDFYRTVYKYIWTIFLDSKVEYIHAEIECNITQNSDKFFKKII
jgi:hypothetical protein